MFDRTSLDSPVSATRPIPTPSTASKGDIEVKPLGTMFDVRLESVLTPTHKHTESDTNTSFFAKKLDIAHF